MFKQTKYKVLRAVLEEGESVWREYDAVEISLGDMGITSAKVKIGKAENDQDIFEDIIIDDVSSFAREFTTKFDKGGHGIFGGDIVKFPLTLKDTTTGEEKTEDRLAAVVWINAAFVITMEGYDSPIYLTEQISRELEVVGNVHQHGAILETPITAEEVFGTEEKKEEGTEEGH